MSNYRIGYLDEEEQWRLTARINLRPDFDVVVLDLVPKVNQIWPVVLENRLDALIVDFRLFESGEVTYDGNDIIQEIQRHNMHFPLFVMTSYENEAFLHCEDVLIIRDKSMFQDKKELDRFKQTLKGRLDAYFKKESSSKQRLLELSKIDVLTSAQKEEKYRLELYLAETDLDNSPDLGLLPSGYTESMESMLKLAKDISNSLNKK